MAVPTLSPQRRERRGGGSPGGRLPGRAVWGRMLLAVAAGFALYAVSPPHDVWWLAPVAFAGFALVVLGRRARAGFGYGLLFGFAFMLPLLGWLQDFLSAQFGPWPWLGVAAVEALFFGLAGAGMARVSRLAAAPVWMAAVFVVAESLRSSVPFGGFPWGRLAFTQATGALLPLASLGGAVFVTFAVALIGAAVAQFVARLRERSGLVAPVATALVPVLAGLAALPTIGTEPDAGTARVAVIQGNAPDIGLDLLYEDDVLHDNHMRAADRFADDVRAGRVPRPDLVVLPEQVGSWGPAKYDPELSRIAAEIGVPMLVGGLGVDEDGQLRNKIVQWDPVTGPGGEYHKQHLVPFAETIPMRPVARLVSPFVDRFERDMVPGRRPGVLDAGPARVGLGMCYDVAYDDVFTGATREGATLLAVPTNNAWYGHSEMSYQQLAMSRLRAVEHGRAVVVAATSGVSAIVRPDGTVAQQTGQFVAQNVVGEVPLRSSGTPATWLGNAPLWVLVALGVGALAFTLRRRSRDV